MSLGYNVFSGYKKETQSVIRPMLGGREAGGGVREGFSEEVAHRDRARKV